MGDSITRWIAKRRRALVVGIIQGKPTVAKTSRAHALSPPGIKAWVADAKRGMETAPRANPLEICAQSEKQMQDPRAASGEAMLERPARTKRMALMAREDGN